MKQSEIEQLLPSVFQRTLRPGTPLQLLLEVMEGLHAPSESALAGVDTFFHPYRTPDAFVPYLAGWVDLGRLLPAAPEPGAADFPAGLGRLRELIAAAAFLSKWRGTAQGLRRFLETATGAEGFEIDEQVAGPDGLPRPFHLEVRVPKAAAPYLDLVDLIVRMEKPAYVTYELTLPAASEAPGDTS